MLGVQFALTARFRRATAPFGIDIVYYFHRYLAVFALVVIAGHYAMLRAMHPDVLGSADPSSAPAHMTRGSRGARAVRRGRGDRAAAQARPARVRPLALRARPARDSRVRARAVAPARRGAVPRHGVEAVAVGCVRRVLGRADPLRPPRAASARDGAPVDGGRSSARGRPGVDARARTTLGPATALRARPVCVAHAARFAVRDARASLLDRVERRARAARRSVDQGAG